MKIDKNKKTVGIVFGGQSPEHEVSIITGVQILQNIDLQKYNVIPIYISKDGKWYTHESFFKIETFKLLDEISYFSREVYLKTNTPKYIYIKTGGIFTRDHQISIDVIFPCIHGGIGEGGVCQGMFEQMDIPYVGCNILGSALSMDKVITRQLINSTGIGNIPHTSFYRVHWKKNKAESLIEIKKTMEVPIIVKPAGCGSSVGVTKVHNYEELENAIDIAFVYDSKIIVERFLEGQREINIAALGTCGEDPILSVCEEVFPTKDFLSYDDKYIKESCKSKGMASANRIIPANISKGLYIDISAKAKQIFRLFQCSGNVRLDFLLDQETEEFELIEINTIPGSMAFYLWAATDIKFNFLIDKLIEIAEKAYDEKQKTVRTFSTNILSNFENTLKSPKFR